MCEVLLEAKSNISVTHRSHVSQVYGDCNLKNLHHSRSSSTTRKLNLYYQEVENARLSKRINNIQCRGVKNSTYMNEMTVRSKCCSLPPIN